VSDFLPGYEASGWQGIGAPKNIPTEIIDKLNGEIVSALTDPRIKSRFGELGGAPLTLAPPQFQKLIADETEKRAKLIKSASPSVSSRPDIPA
jgi:tripartite-type tricarboxylate transporter receptor subunit TctC